MLWPEILGSITEANQAGPGIPSPVLASQIATPPNNQPSIFTYPNLMLKRYVRFHVDLVLKNFLIIPTPTSLIDYSFHLHNVSKRLKAAASPYDHPLLCFPFPLITLSYFLKPFSQTHGKNSHPICLSTFVHHSITYKFPCSICTRRYFLRFAASTISQF